jgi:hypothetical protein
MNKTPTKSVFDLRAGPRQHRKNFSFVPPVNETKDGFRRSDNLTDRNRVV